MNNQQTYEKPEAEIFVLNLRRVLLKDSLNSDGNEKPKLSPGNDEEYF